MNDGFAWGVFYNLGSPIMFRTLGFPSWWILMDEDYAGLARNDG